MRLAAVLLLTSACAVGAARPDGTVFGVAVGQAELRSCARDVKEEEAACTYIRGGAISPEGAKVVGPVSGLFQLVLGLL